MGKRIITCMLVACTMLFSFSSCYTHGPRHGHVPPGQAKKIYGGKSAKRYAPGQQKKNKGKKRHPSSRNENLFPGRR